jgi:ribosomal protein L20
VVPSRQINKVFSRRERRSVKERVRRLLLLHINAKIQANTMTIIKLMVILKISVGRYILG